MFCTNLRQADVIGPSLPRGGSTAVESPLHPHPDPQSIEQQVLPPRRAARSVNRRQSSHSHTPNLSHRHGCRASARHLIPPWIAASAAPPRNDMPFPVIARATQTTVIARAGRPVAIQGGWAVWPGAAVNPWIAASAMPPRNDKRYRHREGRQARGDPGRGGGVVGRGGKTSGLPRRLCLLAMTNGAVIARAGRPVAIQGRGAVWPGAAVTPWIAASASPPRNDKRSRHREGRQARGDPGRVGGLAGRGGKPLDCRVGYASSQ
jgi:hypothetical protein